MEHRITANLVCTQNFKAKWLSNYFSVPVFAVPSLNSPSPKRKFLDESLSGKNHGTNLPVRPTVLDGDQLIELI